MFKYLQCFALAGLLFQQRPLSEISADLERLSAELKNRPEIIIVAPGESVQAAVDKARGGDTIILQAGAKYTGALTLPAKAGVVTIKSSSFLPERRITPFDATQLPIIASGNNGPAVTGIGATNYTFDGIQFESTVNGAGEILTFQDAQNIKLDRILIVAGMNGQKRAIRGNGQNITLTRSYIANIWAPGQDSQAFCAWDGAGPYSLIDNYLEAASENVMFGGADSLAPDRVPADILVEGNFFTKRLEWKPVAPATVSGKAVKNLFELKAAKRVVIRHNVFENVWTDAQDGYAILFKSVNQNGTAPWSATEDVLFEGNSVRNVEKAFKVQGETFEPNSNGTTQHGGRTTGIVIRGNEVQTPGTAMTISGSPGTIVIDRSTFVNGYTFLSFDGNPMQSLTVTNVLANHNSYGVKGTGTGIGTPTLTKFATTWTWSNNALLGGAGKGVYPPTTYFDLPSIPTDIVIGK